MKPNGHASGTAVIYVRISTEEQLKKSATNIATQTKKCAEACEHAGLELVKVFTDEGESAYKQAASERPALQAMVEYLKRSKRKVTHVVTADLSRLARRIEDQASLLAAFRKGGLTYMSVDEPHASDNSAYCGWVKQKDIIARGTFEPLVSDALFERTQQALNERSKRQKHVKHHEDWPLRRFVLCAACGKPLTAGWVKNAAGKPYGFYFCAQKGCRSVSLRKEYLEHAWLTLLLMTQPREEYLRRLPELVEAAWRQRKVRAEEERRQLTSRLGEQNALNKKSIEARVKGKISDEDFATMKKAIADEIEQIEHSLKRLDEERDGVQELAKIKEYELKNLWETWMSGDLN